MGKPKKPIQVIHKKLGRSNADGFAYLDKRVIEIDDRLKGFRYLEIVIHEVLHVQNPKWPEITVEARAKELAKILWDLHFRQVDNHKE